MADLHHLGRDAGRRRVGRAARPVRSRRRGAAGTVSTYSGGMRRRLDLAMTLVGAAAGDLPRRADHRTRPAQPPHDVGDHPRARRRRRHDLPHDAVPRRGRRARRPHRRARPRPASSPRAPPTSSSGRSRAATSASAFARRRTHCDAAGGRLAGATHERRRARPAGPDRRHASPRCATCSSGSTTPASRSSSCRSTRPTSTTCSSRSPASRPTNRRQPAHDRPRLHRSRDSATMLRRNLRHLAALPVDDDQRPDRHADRVPAALRLRLRRTLGAGLGSDVAGGHAGRDGTSTTSPPASSLMTVAAAVQGTAIVVAWT